jgi:transcription elongation factor Elf1
MKEHNFKLIEENLSHSSQKNVYRCDNCGQTQKMYIRTEKQMNDYFNTYYPENG